METLSCSEMKKALQCSDVSFQREREPCDGELLVGSIAAALEQSQEARAGGGDVSREAAPGGLIKRGTTAPFEGSDCTKPQGDSPSLCQIYTRRSEGPRGYFLPQPLMV